MLKLNYNHLYYFLVIAQQGSIIKASRKLHLTQPTLSGQLKQLEDFLGKKLFDRKVRQLVLNKHGEVVLKYAKQIFNLGEEMLLSVRGQSGKEVHIVRVGMLPSISKTLIHKFLLPFFDNFQFAVHVEEGNLSYLLRELETNTLDLIISDSPISRSSRNFKSTPLKHRHFIAVGTNVFAKAKTQFPNSLNGLPFATFTQNNQIRAEIDTYLRSKNITPRLVGEFDDIVLLQFVAERGKCFTILPKHSVAEALANQSLIEIGAIPSLKSEIWAITRADNKLAPKYLKMLQH